MKKLYFIRHGECELNLQGLIAGNTESPLTEAGKAQAKAAGLQAKDLGIDLIVSSPLSRAYDTAKIVAEEIGYPVDKIQTNPLLKERDHGKGERTPWWPGINDAAFEGMENNEALVKRAHQAWDWINSLDGTVVLIVSHGGIGRAIRSIVKPDMPMSHPSRLANGELHEWI